MEAVPKTVEVPVLATWATSVPQKHQFLKKKSLVSFLIHANNRFINLDFKVKS